MSQTIEVKVPDIGDFKDVPVIEVMVKPGDTVKAEDSLVTLESDKATMDVPSPAAGVVRELKVKIGDKVSEGTLVLLLDARASSSEPTGVGSEAPMPAAAPSPSPIAATASSVTEVRVPDIGDFKDVPVIEIMVKVGDAVKAEDPLVTLESDKATMDVPAPVAGVVQAIAVKLGDKVSQGSLVVTLAATGAAVAAPAASPAAAPAAAQAAAPAAAATTSSTPAPVATAPAGKAHASPSVRKFARELGVDVAKVAGSGPKGRILHGDVQNYVKGVMAQAAGGAPATAGASLGGGLDLLPWPKVDFAKFGAIETKPLSRIKKISGQNLARNWVMVPAVTYHEDADITDLEAFRVQVNKENEKSGQKLTMLAFLIKACVKGLQKFPEFNTSLDGDNLVYKKYFNIAFAADTPNGLVVPVVKNADQKGVFEIAAETGELAKKAREGKLGPAEMQGACFTISSLGGIGGTYFAPIVNAPEVAILGVNKSATKPVWDGKAFVPRLILPLSLTADHRVIDGAMATRFNVYVAQLLADMRRMML
jgi:pyruvate dehydrogenase E2 component (dihydrolipoamide acetyltransferase)